MHHVKYTLIIIDDEKTRSNNTTSGTRLALQPHIHTEIIKQQNKIVLSNVRDTTLPVTTRQWSKDDQLIWGIVVVVLMLIVLCKE